MGYSFDMYDTIDKGFSQAESSLTWMAIALLLAVIGGILIYFLFLKKENESKYIGFVKY